MNRKHKQHYPKPGQDGFTIIESLLAIIVVGVLLTAMAPVFVLATATRMQAKRVERGTQAAKAYMDGVRAGAIKAPEHRVKLDQAVDTTTKETLLNRSKFAEVTGPTSAGSLSCVPNPSATTGDIYPYCKNEQASSLYCFDLDDTAGCNSTSNQDVIVQAFRSTPDVAINEPNKGYLLVVRAYRADAFKDSGTLKTQKDTGKKQATYSGGLGARQSPLTEITTEINPKKPDYRDFCDRVGCKE